VTTTRDLARLRLVAQRIAGPGFATAAEAVTWLTAVQAQDFRSSVAAVAVRLVQGTDPAAVEAALDAGEIVRSWPMRGTLHLVPAADLRWLLTLGPPRVATTMARRQRELELDDTTLGRARAVAVEALRGRRDVDRTALLRIWDDAGIATTGQRGYHLLVHLAHAGAVCFGPMAGRHQAVVLVDEWIPAPRELDRAEALAEIVLRYFRSHGPATISDFTFWTRLTVADAKTGLAVARPQLESILVDGTEYLMDPATPDRLADHRAATEGAFLLPAFDELVLGYRDRSASVPPAFFGQLAPGGNGMFRAMVVDDSQVVGTWKRSPGGDGPPDATPFTTFSPAATAALERRAQVR
jgi:hypothetical protein